jgi:hypothetical protein
MNILYTSVVGIDTLESQENIAGWRNAHQIVEEFQFERLASYLRFDPAAELALIDAIVCSAVAEPIAWDGDGPMTLQWPVTAAVKLAQDVRSLPESCAMRDGRKWRAIPFVIVRAPASYYEMKDELLRDTHAQFVTQHAHYPSVTLRHIRAIVDAYQDRVLEDYVKLGVMIRVEKGRAQIGPALRRKNPQIESEFYHAPADRRRNRGWVTVRRDSDGIRHDVELFQELISRRATEREMHKFFEEHPAILMEARLGIPISHRPTFARPAGETPDYAFSPILGPYGSQPLELMELKGPGEETLARSHHRGFSHKVHAAIDQVRDYDRYLDDPSNIEAVLKAFGYLPERSKLAVLIGRAPVGNSEKEIFEQRRSETSVSIITYDEILQKQADQLPRLFR